ncbi:MAG: 50S ribosomal protein L9 [Candidatus Kerfeldbacteria bacterium]|nr:50S ribosomal protein L9 [Candidatus Kerfeldbacteria bacterium]
MKVLLTAPVEGVGRAGQILTVPDGYARNFLIPKKLAVPATAAAIAQTSKRQADQTRQLENDRRQERAIAETLSASTVRLTAKATPQGHLFGGIGPKEIANAIAEQFHLTIAPNAIKIDKRVESIGRHVLTLKLAHETSSFTLEVAAET